MPVLVSVVVPTCRRPELLRRCLSALLAQDFDPAAYEIVVADAAPSVGARRMVDDLAAAARASAPAEGQPPALERDVGMPLASARSGLLVPAAGLEVRADWLSHALADVAGGTTSAAEEERGPRVRYIPVVRGHGPAAARNAGWQAARGQIVAFTDDDCIPDAGWLREGVGAFGDRVVAVMGRTDVPLPAAPTDYQRSAARLAGAEFVTANSFYRRDALATVGGFDERFAEEWRADSDLFFTLLQRGGKFVAAPAALVSKPADPAAWGASLRQQRLSMYNALLYKKHPQLYRSRIQAAPPWGYYGAVALLLASAAALAAGGGLAWGLAAGGGLAWALLTARLCLLRLRGSTRGLGHVAEMIVTSALIPPLAIFWRLRGAIRYRVWFL